MIDVANVLASVPTFDAFCSVRALHTLAETLRTESTSLTVDVAGASANGLPIHHIRGGDGPVKALVVGFPHCHEPIGGLTTYSLITLLDQRHPELARAGVEWHIVPCIDPDGALLNEGWSQTPFDLGRYMTGYHIQRSRDQVDCSFPISYKALTFSEPTQEAEVLRQVLVDIRPDFYFTLHNSYPGGGAWLIFSRPVADTYYRQLHALLAEHDLPLQRRPPHLAWGCNELGEGIVDMFTTRRWYDCVAESSATPEKAVRFGATSWEYLADLNEEALTFVAELPYAKHPLDGSTTPTTQPVRHLKLRVRADSKYLAGLILEEWDNVRADVDSGSPFYRKMIEGLSSGRSRLHERLPPWSLTASDRDLLFNPGYGGLATEGERLNVYLTDHFIFLCNSYEFVRLLKASPQTRAVRRAAERLEGVFADELAALGRRMDIDSFEPIDHDTLVRVQLGSGLIALNSVLSDAGH